MTRQTNNLTEGNVYKTLIAFAVPFLLANFAQALYGGIDMAIVGWFSNAAGLSAVSTGTQVIQIITSVISGLSMGGTILIGQYCGARQDKDTTQTISTMLSLFAIAAVVFTGIMLFATNGIVSLLQTPPEAVEQACQYVFICSCGIIFIFAYNALSAMLRGFGDSKSPLIFICVATVVNIVLDLIFVGGLHMGPMGAAIATVIAQAVSVVIAICYLKRKKFIFEFKLKNFRIHKDKAQKLFRFGLPVSLQESTLSLSFLFITAIVNNLGVVASAAIGVISKFELFAMLPATAFCGAISAIAAQNIGANRPERAKKSLNASVLLAFICSLFFFVWAQISPESIMSIFKADAQVTVAGAQYLRSFSVDFLLVAFGFTLNGFLNGCGKTTFAMITGMLASLVIRVPLAYLFVLWFPDSLFGLGWAAPIATAISVTISLIYIKTGRWKKSSVLD